jgi:hypothetical protein
MKNLRDAVRYQNLDLLITMFEEMSDLSLKQSLLEELFQTDIEIAKRLIKSTKIEKLIEELEEHSSIEEIFSFLIILNKINPRRSLRILKSIFSTESDSDINFLHKKCLDILNQYLNPKEITLGKALNQLRKESDERRLALVLTDIAPINGELANRFAWLFFDQFINSPPSRFLDCLRIISWGNRDLLRIISLAGTEKLRMSSSLEDFLNFLFLAQKKNPSTASLILMITDDFVAHLIKLINENSDLSVITETLILIDELKSELTNLIIYSKSLNQINVIRCIKNTKNLVILSKFLFLISKNPNSELSRIIKWESFPRDPIIQLVKNYRNNGINIHLNLNIISDLLYSIQILDLNFAKLLTSQLDPKLFSISILQYEDINVIANIITQINQIKPEFFHYSFKYRFSEFIKHIDNLILNIENLELLAEFTIVIYENFSKDPQFPLFLTLIRKRIQREQDLDNLGSFLGILGQYHPPLLQEIALHHSLLTYYRLFPTDKLGHLLMSTSLYDFNTAVKLGEALSSRFSAEPDLNLIRVAFGSISLGSNEVANKILESNSFDTRKIVARLNPKLISCVQIAFVLETFNTVTNRIINDFLTNESYFQSFIENIKDVEIPDFVKIIANSNWMNKDLTHEIAKKIAKRNLTLKELHRILKTGAWANPKFAYTILYWQNLAELGDILKVEHLNNRNNTLIEELVYLINEIMPEFAQQLLQDNIWKEGFMH